MRKPYSLLGLTAAVVLILVWIYLPVLTKYRELRGQEERMTREIEILDKKIAALEEEKSLLKSDVAYLEKVIRQEMGFVRSGETLLKFVQDEPGKPVPAPDEHPMPPE